MSPNVTRICDEELGDNLHSEAYPLVILKVFQVYMDDNLGCF